MFLRAIGYTNPFTLRSLNRTGKKLGTKSDADGREYMELATDIKEEDVGKKLF